MNGWIDGKWHKLHEINKICSKEYDSILVEIWIRNILKQTLEKKKPAKLQFTYKNNFKIFNFASKTCNHSNVSFNVYNKCLMPSVFNSV